MYNYYLMGVLQFCEHCYLLHILQKLHKLTLINLAVFLSKFWYDVWEQASVPNT